MKQFNCGETYARLAAEATAIAKQSNHPVANKNAVYFNAINNDLQSGVPLIVAKYNAMKFLGIEKEK